MKFAHPDKIFKDRKGRSSRHERIMLEREIASGRREVNIRREGRKFHRQNAPVRLHLRKIIVHDDALLAVVGS